MSQSSKGKETVEGTALWRGHSSHLLSVEMIGPLQIVCVPAVMQDRVSQMLAHLTISDLELTFRAVGGPLDAI